MNNEQWLQFIDAQVDDLMQYFKAEKASSFNQLVPGSVEEQEIMEGFQALHQAAGGQIDSPLWIPSF